MRNRFQRNLDRSRQNTEYLEQYNGSNSKENVQYENRNFKTAETSARNLWSGKKSYFNPKSVSK